MFSGRPGALSLPSPPPAFPSEQTPAPERGRCPRPGRGGRGVRGERSEQTPAPEIRLSWGRSPQSAFCLLFNTKRGVTTLRPMFKREYGFGPVQSPVPPPAQYSPLPPYVTN